VRYLVNGDSSGRNLISKSLVDAAFRNESVEDDPITAEAPYSPAGIPVEEVEQARIVDNVRFKYVVLADVRNMPNGTNATLYAIRVEYQLD
jgi:hypothetical protein